MSKELILAVENRHVESCGHPPGIFKTDPNMFSSYFEDENGDQFIFRFNWDIREGWLWCGDASWEEPFTIKQLVDGELVASKATYYWIKACMMVIEETVSCIERLREPIE